MTPSFKTFNTLAIAVGVLLLWFFLAADLKSKLISGNHTWTGQVHVSQCLPFV